MQITSNYTLFTCLLIWISLIGAPQFPARAALQCTSLEVSRSQNSSARQTVTLTLLNTAASSAVIVKPDLAFKKLQNNSWRDTSNLVFVKPDAENSWQIDPGKTAVLKFHIQFFDDVLEDAAKSTFRVMPDIEYYLQQDNLLQQLTDGKGFSANWNIDNPAAGFGANAFPGHDGTIQIHVNNNHLKSRLTLRSAKSTFAPGQTYLAGILNKSDRSGWDSPLNKGAAVIEYDSKRAIRAHSLHVFEVPFWNWELTRFTAAKNSQKIQMEIWLRGWQLHQTGNWWIQNAFIVPQERIKVLSSVMPSFPRTRAWGTRGFSGSGILPLVLRRDAGATKMDSRLRGNDDFLTISQHQKNSSIIYLGQDRATQGNWRGNYGNESFILCAMQAPQDVVGGRLLPKRYWPNSKNGEVQTAGVWSSWQGEFHYAVETGDPKEPVRHYIPPNQLTTNDKRALLNPLEGGRRYASWDDHGETHPFDWKGPDLIAHLDIPKGLHKLSFYFVDWDFANTFRPRSHRIFIEEDNNDKKPKVLSSAYVSHFGEGVYKTFAVRGPVKLRVRITKDASVCAVLSGIFLDEINPKVPLSQAGVTSKVLLSKAGVTSKVPLFKGGFRGISAEDEMILNPQTKLSNFAAYIKNNPPANLAQAKARVQHLVDKGEVGLARLAVPAWLHRAAEQSSVAEISSYREAVTMFALRDSDYASDLAQQLVRHALAHGGSKVLLLKIGTDLMQLAELHQNGTLRSRAAYPVVAAFYRRLQGEFGVKGLGEEAAYNFATAKAESAGYHHGRERRAIIEYQKYAQQWPKSIYAIKAHQKVIQLANVLCVPMERRARRYASIAADSAKALTRWLSENRDTEQIPTEQNDPQRELYFSVKQSVNQFAALSARIDGKSK